MEKSTAPDNGFTPPPIDEQELRAAARLQAQRNLIVQSKWGGVFYLVGLIGLPLLEPTLLHSTTAWTLFLAFPLLAWYRYSLSLLAQQQSTSSLYKRVVGAMLFNQVIWSYFSCWIISQLATFNASVGLLLGACSCYAAGTVMRTLSDQKLQLPSLCIFILPQALTLTILLPSLQTFIGIGMMATFFFFLSQLGKKQAITYEQAVLTSMRLELQSVALEQARKAAMQGSEAKSLFLSHMSHEIRTPLQSIIGTSELLETTLTDKAQLQNVETLRHASRLLMGLINDILDFSKITSDSLTLNIAPFDLAALMENLYTIMLPIAANKGLTLRCEIARDVPRHLEGDQLRLQQILVNLLTNAVKFSHAGEIVWRVLVQSSEGNKINLRCEIIDHGVGIAEQDIDRIFDQFTQVESFHGDIRGTGLGLSICKRLVELMQGEIGVQSEPTIGSTFWFRIPLIISAASQNLAEPESIIPSNKTEQKQVNNMHATTANQLPTILIADDNDLNLELFRQFLKQLQCTCITVANGAEAVTMFKSAKPELVFMDCNMPILDGKSATREIRLYERDLGLPHTAIVALTALVQEEDIQDCKDAGMDDHLAKPMRLAEFRATCLKWLPGLQPHKPAPSQS